MKPKPYKINGNWDAEESVVKINYGRAYVIAKFKKQIQGLQTLENTIAAFIRGNEPNQSSIYYHLLMYVKRNPGNTFKVEPIMENIPARGDREAVVHTAYELLTAEQTALDMAKKDSHCLNNNTRAYIPMYNEESGMYGWISKADALNFKKWYQKTHKGHKYAE
jgi:hypothetical protein